MRGTDYATGKKINLAKKEEIVRQEVEKWLVDELRYERKQIDIEYRLRAGSATYRADIAVFKTGDADARDQNCDVLGLVETKHKSLEEAVKQLKTYMAVCPSCEWGVAASEEAKKYFLRKKNGTVASLRSIPNVSSSVFEVVRLKKGDLKPAQNLKLRFKTMLYHLYSNTNIQGREKLCKEMTKILFCKIHDEQLKNDTPHFQAPENKSAEEVKRDIENKLWKKVLVELESTGVFSKGDRIILDADSVAYVVGELESVSLLQTDRDAIGDAFEVFAERYFRGDKGEFFTPRVAVKNAIKLLSPDYAETIIDPACGSGGFLISALEHVWDNIRQTERGNEHMLGQAPKYIYGIDKEPDLVNVARSYMALLGDGHTNIGSEDSLKPPSKWSEATRVMMSKQGGGGFKKFRHVFTNPPFGAGIKVEHEYMLRNYQLGHQWRKNSKSGKWEMTAATVPTPPQILFLELCYKWLEPSGTLCIVLPESVLGNPTQGFVRQWLLDNMRILAIWDCPQGLFQPHTSTKTCMLFAQKCADANESIFMSSIKKCGHDARGAEIRLPNGKLDEEFSIAVDDWRRFNSERAKSKKCKVSFCVPRSSLRGDNILVPRIYQAADNAPNHKTMQIRELEHLGLVKLRTMPCKVRQSEYSEEGTVQYIRTSDLGNRELRSAMHRVSEQVYLENKQSQDLRELDILMVKDGGHRIGETVMLFENDLHIVVQGHFYLFRSINHSRLDPYYLCWALLQVQSEIAEKRITQTTLSSITIERLRECSIPICSPQEQKKIAKKVREILNSRQLKLHALRDLSV